MRIEQQRLKLCAARVHIVSARNQLMSAKRNLQQAKDLSFANELISNVDFALAQIKEV
jgi:hypothetical protein